MKNILILILVLSNAATAYLFFTDNLMKNSIIKSLNVKIEELTANTTTESERENYGKACVDWLKENKSEDGFQLGRSWKKHGQLVFEVLPPQEENGKNGETLICTVDVQSGVMFAYEGQARDEWMFY